MPRQWQFPSKVDVYLPPPPAPVGWDVVAPPTGARGRRADPGATVLVPVTIIGVGSGIIVQQFPGTDWGEVLVLAQQADGKILAGGTADYGLYRGQAGFPSFTSGVTRFCWVLTRYSTDGSLDTTFGAGGTVQLNWHVEDAELTDLAVLPSGKILAAGVYWDQVSLTMRRVVARFSSDGTLDEAFGSWGVAMLSGGSGYIGQTRVGVQSTGNVIVGSSAVNSGIGQFAIWGLYPNGNVNTTFGSSGVVSAPIVPGRDTRLWSIVIQSDDRIVCGGSGQIDATDGHDAFFVARFTSSGGYDTTFGGTGFFSNGVITQFPFDLLAQATSVLQQADGKIVAVGTAAYDASNHAAIALARYTTAGVLDTTFGV